MYIVIFNYIGILNFIKRFFELVEIHSNIKLSLLSYNIPDSKKIKYKHHCFFSNRNVFDMECAT